MTVSEPLNQALHTLSAHWGPLGKPWLVGGSCGLLLQSVPISAQPRDLDVYIDSSQSDRFHRALERYALDEPAFSETDRYRSTLSHYQVGGVKVELVSGFEVFVPGAEYRIQIEPVMMALSNEHRMEGAAIRLMPLAHELLFNLLRDRPDRYESISGAMAADLATHLPAIRTLLRTNVFDGHWLAEISRCLDVDADRFAEEAERCR